MLENTDIQKMIDDHGWQSIFVGDTELSDCFIYSIGFEVSFNHPEIIFFDYGVDNSHSLMSHIAEIIKSGKSLVGEESCSEILTSPYEAKFIDINERVQQKYLLLAGKFYVKPFRAMLMLLSDETGIFPHEEGYRLRDQKDAVKILAEMG